KMSLWWNNIVYNISIPFRNLSVQERILQITRLFTCFAAITFALSCLVAPVFTNSTYVSRINCAQLDVSYGLYKSLRNSVSQTPEVFTENRAGISLGNSLTNSEITLISQYAETQVASAPQYCIMSLWNWCFGNYETYEAVDRHGHMNVKKKNNVLTCFAQKGLVFDYLNQLEAINLQIILAYAYQTLSYRSASYISTIALRNSRFQYSVNAIIYACCSQFVILFSTLVIYANRGAARNLSKIPPFILHIITLISLTSAVTMIVGISLITNLLQVTTDEVADKLGDFGVSFQMGNAWYSLLCSAAFFTVSSSACWIFPVWCANPTVSKHDEENSIYQVGTSKLRKLKNKIGLKDKRTIELEEDDEDQGNVFNNRRPSFGNNYEHEEEMRKLGQTLSKKASVRTTRSTNKLEDQGVMLENFTFKDNFATIQEETFDGYSSRSVSRSASEKIDRKPSDKRQRQLTRELLKSPFDEEDISPRNSFLEDDELELLNNQMFSLK
ncbi:hypothetical protein G210_2176, partial [Candida maltosa Xu316]